MKNILAFVVLSVLFSSVIFVFDSVIFPGKSRALWTEQPLVTNSATDGSTKTSLKADANVELAQIAEDPVTAGGLISSNWGKLMVAIMALYDIIARMVPTIQNNTILSFITKLINAVIPNKRKGGGVF